MPLTKRDSIGTWVKHFKKSDAPQFKGKSDKEKRDMAVAAYLSKEEVNLDEISKATLGNYAKKATMDVSKRAQKLATTSPLDKPNWNKSLKKLTSRQVNVHKAIDKLAKEEGEPGHYMYKDGKKKLVHNKAEHDDAVIDGWKMKESVNEAADPQMDRVKQLVRLGLMDKKDLAKIVRALTLMKDGKVVPPRERAVLFDMLNELIGMITGDDAIFQRARKAVREAAEDDEPASPDEESMAMRQLDFIAYAAEEVMDHIEDGKEFPEWMQNKLTKVHTGMEGLHSSLGAHGDNDKEDDVKESVSKVKVERATNRLMKKEDVRTADRKPEVYVAPDGKKHIRMVPVDKKVVSKDD